jgi:hypothetical protein
MKQYTSTHKKGQIWGMDLIVAVLIFSVALSSFYFYTINNENTQEETLKKIEKRGKLITDILLSEGTTVQEIGLLTNGKINQTKLEQFNNLTTTNYEQTKQLFNTEYNYYIFLDQQIQTTTGTIDGIGKPGINRSNIEALTLIKINRITIYQNKPVSMTLYIWQE